MRTLVKFRSIMNVVWGTKVNGKEAFAFVKGFPATFIMTERRAIVVAEFVEKQGWLQKKTYHRLCFEAGLHQLKDFKINLIPEKRIFTGFISFHPHNQLGEGTIIQFLKMRPEIGNVIEDYLTDLKIKIPVADSGIVLVDDLSISPEDWLSQRFKKKVGQNARALLHNQQGEKELNTSIKTEEEKE